MLSLDGSPPFLKAPNERCLNGLQFDYVLKTEPSWDVLADELQEAFGPKTVRLEERLGACLVIRLILGFVMELRLGEEGNRLALIHRVSAPESRRRETERFLEEVLTRLTEP